MKQDILPVVQQPQEVMGFYRVVELAMGQGANAEQLGQLLALQERHEANEARKAYNAAMAQFKANPPKVFKDKRVAFDSKGGRTAYNHATLGNVVSTVSAALSGHGLAATWKTETQDGGSVRVTCRITHEAGHFEETSLTSAPDGSGGKNSIQAIGSAVTYLQRYTLLALCGLATYEDDDGQGVAPIEYITEQQAGTIYDMCNELGGTTLARLLKWLGLDEVSQIGAKQYERVIAELKMQGKK